MKIPQSFLGNSHDRYYSSIGIDSDELNPVNLRYTKNSTGFMLITPFIFAFRLFRVAVVKLCLDFLDCIEDFIVRYSDFFKI